MGIPLRRLYRELSPEEWVIYRAFDCIEPQGTIAHYGSRIIAARYKQLDAWESEMPPRYQQYTGIQNATPEEMQEIRDSVAREFQNFINAWGNQGNGNITNDSSVVNSG